MHLLLYTSLINSPVGGLMGSGCVARFVTVFLSALLTSRNNIPQGITGGLENRMKENLVGVRSCIFIAANCGLRFLLPTAACVLCQWLGRMSGRPGGNAANLREKNSSRVCLRYILFPPVACHARLVFSLVSRSYEFIVVG